MNRNLLHRILLALIPLIVAGCGSARKSVRSGSSGRDVSASSGGEHGGGSSTPADGGTAYLNELLKEISDPMAHDLISEAGDWIGTRYIYGGTSREGTDCSGLVMSVYKDVCGVKIPRTTHDQVRYCTRIARNKLRPGDLIFFSKATAPDSVSHVGMYVGDGRMIHASSSRGVIVSTFDSGYWADRYYTGARVAQAPQAYASMGDTHAIANTNPVANPVASPDATLAVNAENASSTSVVVETTPPRQPLSIDLLDQIITSKIDSITSTTTPIPY